MASVTYKPAFTVQYNGRTITDDVARFLIALTYTDRVSGQSDELQLELDDTDGRWRAGWMPAKGDKLVVGIGDGTAFVNAGTFEVDEIEYETPPDKLILRAVAAGMKKAVRTRNSTAHEAKTLGQIAQAIADKNGFTLEGEIEDIQIARATQHRETDLAFLRRLADTYGYVFSVRDAVMTFYNIFQLEANAAAVTLTPADFTRCQVRIKSEGTYEKTRVASRNPSKNEVVETEYVGASADNADGIPFSQVVAGDTQVINNRTEDAGQADRKAKAAHHKANSREVTASLEMGGRPLMVAGNNFALHGMGEFSGVFHIEESVHTITRNGYTTSVSCKKVNTVPADARGRVSDDPVPPAQLAQI